MEKKIISGEEEIYLAEDKNFYERARELAQKTKKDKKYPFVITYDANQKGTLMSAIESMEGVVLSEEENKVRAQLNMEQLKAIKELDCTVGVQNGTQKYSATREEATEASTGYVLTNNENSGIMTIEADAVAASVEPASYSSYCPDNCCPSPDVLKGMQSATPLAIGRYVSGNICCPGCKKWYKIVVDSSGVYTIHAEGDIDTIGMLYDENGNYIGGNDDYAGKTDFRLIRSLTAGKTYYLKVSGAFGDTGSYVVRVTTKVLPSSVELSHSSIGLKVGETTQIVASILPQNATEQRVTYHCFFTDVISVDSNTGCITALKPGTATVYVYDWNNHCAPAECEVTVNGMLIYRTREREIFGFAKPTSTSDVTPIIAEDLTYATKSEVTLLTNDTSISSSDLYVDFETQFTVEQRVDIIKSFFAAKLYDNSIEFKNVLNDMVDFFVDGSGGSYSNDILTVSVKNHPKTQQYVKNVVEIVQKYIIDHNGKIDALIYDEDLWIHPGERNLHPMVSAMLEANIMSPFYDDETLLILAIHSWYGNKIELESFCASNEEFSANLVFTFYDHFGVDTNDLSVKKLFGLTSGMFPAFRQWYILQHWDELRASKQPKPYVTNVSFSVPISGKFI